MSTNVIPRTWRYPLAGRITIAVLAAALIGTGLFIALIPFFAGGGDAVVYAILGTCGAIVVAFGLFLALGFSAFARTVVALDASALRAVVPVERGWLIVPRLRAIDLPPATVRAVERRTEITKFLGLSTVRQALSIVTTGGARIGLLTAAETSMVRLPLDEIAAAIANAAGITVTDGGTVYSKAIGLYGAAASDWNEPPLDVPAAQKARRGAAITLQIIVALMAVTFIVRACSH
ncbi:MAG TPA: hypothetical protein VHT05_09990 [Candidatus Elarobacter sp.]|nr:hypothetical protein [Candidatus Elarobacter sp.]